MQNAIFILRRVNYYDNDKKLYKLKNVLRFKTA